MNEKVKRPSWVRMLVSPVMGRPHRGGDGRAGSGDLPCHLVRMAACHGRKPLSSADCEVWGGLDRGVRAGFALRGVPSRCGMRVDELFTPFLSGRDKSGLSLRHDVPILQEVILNVRSPVILDPSSVDAVNVPKASW